MARRLHAQECRSVLVIPLKRQVIIFFYPLDDTADEEYETFQVNND
jgi:hypothetical protein